MTEHDDFHYVGFWARFAAFLIDSVAASLLLAPLALSAGRPDAEALMDATPEQARELLSSMLIGTGLEMLIIGAIFIGFWIYFAATPGKLLFKTYIVRADNFAPATASQCLVRYLGYFLSLFPLGLGFVWIGFDARKQGWHDKLAGTVVINRPPARSPG